MTILTSSTSRPHVTDQSASKRPDAERKETGVSQPPRPTSQGPEKIPPHRRGLLIAIPFETSDAVIPRPQAVAEGINPGFLRWQGIKGLPKATGWLHAPRRFEVVQQPGHNEYRETAWTGRQPPASSTCRHQVFGGGVGIAQGQMEIGRLEVNECERLWGVERTAVASSLPPNRSQHLETVPTLTC